MYANELFLTTDKKIISDFINNCKSKHPEEYHDKSLNGETVVENIIECSKATSKFNDTHITKISLGDHGPYFISDQEDTEVADIMFVEWKDIMGSHVSNDDIARYGTNIVAGLIASRICRLGSDASEVHHKIIIHNNTVK